MRSHALFAHAKHSIAPLEVEIHWSVEIYCHLSLRLGFVSNGKVVRLRWMAASQN